ncbi:MAG: hypothetical protein IPM23_01545 [Candidatus Melainabacteria bacterium]|nr:hypothetical protein [Candidatus Melainabacteria bacterium]
MTKRDDKTTDGVAGFTAPAVQTGCLAARLPEHPEAEAYRHFFLTPPEKKKAGCEEGPAHGHDHGCCGGQCAPEA